MLGRWTTALQLWPAGSTENPHARPQEMACSEQPSAAGENERGQTIQELRANPKSHNHLRFLRRSQTSFLQWKAQSREPYCTSVCPWNSSPSSATSSEEELGSPTQPVSAL